MRLTLAKWAESEVEMRAEFLRNAREDETEDPEDDRINVVLRSWDPEASRLVFDDSIKEVIRFGLIDLANHLDYMLPDLQELPEEAKITRWASVGLSEAAQRIPR